MTEESEKTLYVRGVPLEENAYLDAAKLFQQTGDIRYAAIAVGKAVKATVGHGGGIPDWAFEACQEYATQIHKTTNTQRGKSRDGQTPPSLREYELIIAELVSTYQSGKQISLIEACKLCGCEDESLHKKYRRWFRDELISPRERADDKSPLGSVDIPRSRRTQEAGVEHFKKLATKLRNSE